MRFVFCVHNHLPFGTPAEVQEHQYTKAYWPLLRVASEHPEIRFVLHNSGCLTEMLFSRKPEYLELLQALVERGQVELLSSPIYEPILAIIPERDRVGQIRAHQELIERLFGVVPRGMWLAERVWEPSLPKVIGQTGLEYVPVDDTAFLQIGIAEKRLYESYVTEEEGLPVRVFPIPRTLRQLIPAARPEEVIAQLLKRQAAGARMAVFADGGERFGELSSASGESGERWLSKFFVLLLEERNRIQSSTFEELVDRIEPAGQIYLPTSTYGELMEWSIAPEPQRRHHDLRMRLEQEGEGHDRLLAMGYWRNFLVRYPEANWLHKRGLDLGRRLRRLEEEGAPIEALDVARRDLWRSQCHDAYWHGVRGGLYAPELRAAVQENLLRAWRAMDAIEHGDASFLTTTPRDVNLDGDPELVVENRELALTLAPRDGASLVSIDVKRSHVNLLDTLARREESYHQPGRMRRGTRPHRPKWRGKDPEQDAPASFQYDPFPLHGLRDHVLFEKPTLAGLKELRSLSQSPARERFEWEREGPGTVRMWASFRLGGATLAIERVLTLDPGAAVFDVRSFLTIDEGIQQGWAAYATELTFGVASPSARFGFDGVADRRLASEDVRPEVSGFRLSDPAHGFDFDVEISPRASLHRFPVEAFSASPGGPETILQGTRVFCAWGFEPGQRRLEWSLRGAVSFASGRAEVRAATGETRRNDDAEAVV